MLVDAGPLIALLDRSDSRHFDCAQASNAIKSQLRTVWPVVTEAIFQLGADARGRLLGWIDRGALELARLDRGDVGPIRELMRKYRDLPMDLADAALVRVAERDGDRDIFTLDRRDFSVYRIGSRGRFRIVP